MEIKENKLLELIKERKKKEKSRPKELDPIKKKENVKKWTSLYRRNINLYASRHLKIRIHPFQHIMLYLMGISQVFFAICSRGLSKSFIVALFSMCKALIFPYSEIVLTATTINQATKMVKNKMENELCKKLSPVLKYYYDQGLIKFSYNKDEVRVDFKMNGSWIIVAPALDSSRGERATLLIYEECRLLKKGIIDSVFEKMAHPRQAAFLNLPEYNGVERWIEECQSIYITSARFKNEWFYRTFKTVVTECYMNKKIPYNFFAADIFLSICHGLKTKSDYFKGRKTSGELDFRMEDLNEMIGEAEDSFFSREMFSKNQIITRSFYEYSSQDISVGNNKNREKLDNEYRALWIDYAFANTTSKEENDNSVIGLLSMFCDKNNKFQKQVEYITTHPAGDSDGMDKKIREMFWDFKCDYIILDLRNGGEVSYNDLTKPWVHPERKTEDWNSHGFTVATEQNLHVVPPAKVEDLKSRTIDPQAIPCIIPVMGTPELNSTMWIDLQKTIRDECISFLIDDLAFSQELEEDPNYYYLTTEERVKIKLPYLQTTYLINEAVNLSQEWKEGRVKLSESRSGTKDRIVALSYGNYILTLLKNKIEKENQSSDFDIDAWANALC